MIWGVQGCHGHAQLAGLNGRKVQYLTDKRQQVIAALDDHCQIFLLCGGKRILAF
tara:strand:- start:10 stop:174 length:165 start_codon:yes stop_codon:yes gene_type:complete